MQDNARFLTESDVALYFDITIDNLRIKVLSMLMCYLDNVTLVACNIYIKLDSAQRCPAVE